MNSLCYIRHTINTEDKFYDEENEFFDSANPDFVQYAQTVAEVIAKSAFRPELERKFGRVMFINTDIFLKSFSPEIIPEMQKKLRQGFGRAIRTEQDSCVVAILDERAGIGGKYHDAALAALPTCPTTEKIEDVQQFIREQKHPDYFL